ncbi:hypothetical protein CQW23_29756 [Capsicum baccatum]|uniref:Hexosyltransferase n=1 Tax=Capsicum baccatum TaxID=33114 RepID=A0A2G2VCF2_CAPBA|nr:hypothetical protein CQW23_29756 [Capsicum baccatum]
MTICGIDPPIILVERNHPSSISGNIRGRYQSGRGSAFKNDGVRGRGNYGGGGRGYDRGDFNRRSEFNNRGVNELLTKAKKRGVFSSLISAICKVYSEDPALFGYEVNERKNCTCGELCCKELPSKHVIHVVIDKMNIWVMQVMFKMKDYRGAHTEVKAVEAYKFSNSSYVPVLKQLESAKMCSSTSIISLRMQPRIPSIWRHLRFYLPKTYPKLHWILFLDADIVVQRDLAGHGLAYVNWEHVTSSNFVTDTKHESFTRDQDAISQQVFGVVSFPSGVEGDLLLGSNVGLRLTSVLSS